MPPGSADPSRRDLLRLGVAGLLPIPRRGEPDLAPFRNLLEGLVRTTGVPGASLAVARGDRLVFSGAAGRLDRDRDEPVRPASLFRIASLSKPITAVALLHLVDRGRIRLDDRIYDVLDLGSRVGKGTALDPRWREVTVLQLLHHQGGWDRDKSGDPMGLHARRAWNHGPDAARRVDSIVDAVLGKPLDFTPGTRFSYSNFGYALLGRAIERAGGQPYGDFVRTAILGPVGATGMRLGRTLLADRAPDEARYHDGDRKAPAMVGPDLGLPTSRPYGTFCLEAMDSNGGWIASAADLVRFAGAVDPESPRALLSAQAYRALIARPAGSAGFTGDGDPKPVYYGCGWLVRRVAATGRETLWHAGALDGTSSFLLRRHDGYSVAALFNARLDPQGKDLSAVIEPLIHRAIARVRDWPEGEPLFPPRAS